MMAMLKPIRDHSVGCHIFIVAFGKGGNGNPCRQEIQKVTSISTQ